MAARLTITTAALAALRGWGSHHQEKGRRASSRMEVERRRLISRMVVDGGCVLLLLSSVRGAEMVGLIGWG